MDRASLINYLIEKYKLSRYLEIGVDNGETFSKINAISKTSVDPAIGRYHYAKPTYKMTSDDFFDKISLSIDKFDIILIDGMHETSQVDKDIKNSLDRLNDGGFIILHDCNPVSKNNQEPIRTTQSVWNGDVWKSIVKFRNNNKEFGCLVIDSDHGLGVINKNIKCCDNFEYSLDYDSLSKNRKQYLGLIQVSEFEL